ncbi:DUF2279 domain-containing protein [Dyadobacter luticola]|jgi:hypothetical protein|uniref:DUF2279 domain-containing protein n=2 Tax=Spirosomataceae TaxID=2896860 RepID=A0A5R9KMK5_9BACT|nr:DUF2279 domain-containing protein [Dyadobacter luticola]
MSVMLFILVLPIVNAQAEKVHDEGDSTKRPNYVLLRAIFAGQSAVYAGSIYGLSKSWYKDPLTKFRIQDDSRDWLQIDKVGHFYTSYQIARHTAALYQKAGLSKKQILIYGAISGVLFQTPIEILDGFSPEYGFSPGDMVANVFGSVVYLGQIALWDEIRIQPKFSFQYTSLAAMRPELLGSTYSQRWLKDYNGQTYWLSFSPRSFGANTSWPAWLCFSVGYGINNMVSAQKNRSQQLGFDPYRQYYVSMDIDLTKIKTRSKILRTLCFMANSVKIPSPSLQMDKTGVRLKPLFF